MKASNNVTLVPANGTFELANTLSMASRCIRHLLPSGRHLIVHPLPADLSPMISDAHWLLENVLCLVGNAIKYSDTGDIDLHVEIVDTPCDNDVLAGDEEEDQDSLLPHSAVQARAASRQGLGRVLSQRQRLGPGLGQGLGQGQGPGQGQGNSSVASGRASFLLTGIRRLSILSASHSHQGGGLASLSPADHIASLVASMGLSPPQPPPNNSTRSIPSGQTLLVTIEDHGVGIPEHMRGTMFQPFRQVQRMAGGTGLGLFSLFKRVEALGGDCGVYSPYFPLSNSYLTLKQPLFSPYLTLN